MNSPYLISIHYTWICHPELEVSNIFFFHVLYFDTYISLIPQKNLWILFLRLMGFWSFESNWCHCIIWTRRLVTRSSIVEFGTHSSTKSPGSAKKKATSTVQATLPFSPTKQKTDPDDEGGLKLIVHVSKCYPNISKFTKIVPFYIRNFCQHA